MSVDPQQCSSQETKINNDCKDIVVFILFKDSKETTDSYDEIDL